MIKMNAGGLVLTGIGAFLILAKGINMIEKAVSDISNASKWRAYYKAFGRNGRTDMVEPDHMDIPKEDPEKEASKEATKMAVLDVINKTVDNLFASKEAENKASEGEIEGVSEEVEEEDKEETSEAPVIHVVKDEEE